MANVELPSSAEVVVVGLGRFGSAVATHLTRLGHQVLAIDRRESLVQAWADQLTYVVQADATDPEALCRLGVEHFEHAIVSIGEDVESSVLTVLALTEIGCKDIWAKAQQERHGRILERTGAHHIVYPESAMGERVAHMITGKIIDFIQFDDDYAIVKTATPSEAFGLTLGEAALRTKYGVTIVGVKRPDEGFTHAMPDTLVQEGDLLIVSGRTEQVEQFAAIT